VFKNFLDNGNCFKLVCGAGNEDISSIKKLIEIYHKAGCRFFDLCAKPEILIAAKETLQGKQAFFCVSVGIEGDPHFKKARIDISKCEKCAKCIEICPQKAILNQAVDQTKCIGCAKCIDICPSNAIKTEKYSKNPEEILPPLIEIGIDCIELHAIGKNTNEIIQKWQTINSLYNGFLSICADRSSLGDKDLISLVKTLTNSRLPYTTIIQADGAPMSGGKDDFNSTLQAVATAELFQKTDLKTYLFISGGTNSKSARLASLTDVKIQGIAIGSYARKIAETQGIQGAKKLVESVTKQHFCNLEHLKPQAKPASKISP